MRKNIINWKRTPCSSLMEILLTVILCLLIVYKQSQQEWTLRKYDTYSNDLTRPYYPSWTWDNKTANWTNAYLYSAEQSADYRSFMKWGNWSTDGVTDPLSPYWWDPQMFCYPAINRTDPNAPGGIYNPSLQPWSMPIIAVVKSESQIQSDLVQLLKLQFQNQMNAPTFIKEFFTTGMAHDLKISRWDMYALFSWTHTNVTFFNTTSEMSFANFTFQEFDSHEAIDQYIKSSTYGSEEQPGICFAFSFEEKGANKYELKLRFSDQEPLLQIPNGNKVKFFSQNGFVPNGVAVNQWWLSGFTMMQNWAANVILKRKSGVSNANILNMVVPYPHQNFEDSNFRGSITLTFFQYIIIFWLPLLYRTTHRIVQEKQSKSQEVMRMMGMTNLPYWLSWWTYFSVISLIISLVGWLILQFTVFPTSNPVLLLVFFVLFGQSLFGMIMVTQSVCNDSKIASIGCSILYFGLAQMAMGLSGETLFWLKILLMCLNPSLCMSLGFNSYMAFGFSPTGVNFSNWQIPIREVSLQMAIFCVVISGVFWLSLGLYLEAAIPKTYGSKRGYCFCFTECLSCCKRKQVLSSSVKDNNDPDFDTKYLHKTCFEPVSKLVAMKEIERQILKISDLEKHYENGTKAVNGVNLKLYQDQIFVLLGHNGAGKTTTISMLSGLFEPTNGSATVFGKNLCGDNYSARRLMGVCPQYDVLFDLLTPEEHLDFFYEMKGAPVDNQKKHEEIQKLMVDVGVDDKKDAMSMTLSGGNKRKLSVAIALVGGSKFLIFDEPTAGMDLNARRHLWNMFKKYKAGRIILMSTHYMDEADILGDRIGIMCAGKMTCLGSSIFLKKKFGIGYNMVVVKDSADPNTLLLPYLHQNLGVKTQITSEIQNEITIKIPEIYASKFTNFFADFDLKLAPLKLRNYGISISSLEEVFMKVGSLTDLSNLDQEAPKKKKDSDSDSDSDPQISDQQISRTKRAPSSSGEDLTYQIISNSDLVTVQSLDSKTDIDQELLPKPKPQPSTEMSSNFSIKQNFNELDTSFCSNTNAVLYKKISVYRRNKMGFVYEICIPLTVILGGIIMGKVIDDNRATPTTTMDANLMFPKTKVVFNPQMVDSLRSNLPTSVFANNMNTQGKMNITFNTNWTTNSSANVYTALNFSYDRANNESYLPPWHSGDYIWYSANKTSQEYKFYTFANTTQTGPVAVFPQIMYESTLRVALSDPELEFTTINTHLPITHFAYYRHQYTTSMVICFTIAVAIPMMMASTVSSIVQERISGLKHLQILSGMQKTSYWVANFIFDFAKFQTVMSITVLAMWIVEVNVEVTYYVFLTVSFALIPFAYATSFLFSSEAAAQILTMFLNFYVISILQSNVQVQRVKADYELQGDRNNWIYRIWPTYVLSDALKFESARTIIALSRTHKIDTDPWNINNQLGCIITNGVNCLVWLTILVVIESCNCRRKPQAPKRWSAAESKQQKKELDEDVNAENMRVADGCVEEIVVQGFSMEFSKREELCSLSKFQAVNNLSFALKIGECFALLGVNGAGKTTTFKSLTNEVLPTAGSFLLGGFDLFTDFDQARKLIGYSPQHNLIFETMNVDEHVQYYARLKGIPEKCRDQIVEETIQRLGLVAQRYVAVGSLSGGNQRKVCAAVALVGNPPIILLDEPSAGMDPKARRFMWEVVAKITLKQQSAIVLTTHSMEEAEALSTKMGIMVKGGVFKCFGSSQHIRNKFGTGYVIEIKIRTLHEDEFAQMWGDYFQESGEKPLLNQNVTSLLGTHLMTELQQEMKAYTDLELLRFVHGYINIYSFVVEICQYFRNCVEVIEIFGNSAKFRVERSEKTIGFVFGLLERCRGQYDISEYSVSQTTLEQIFQAFADLNFSESILKFSMKDGQLNFQQ